MLLLKNLKGAAFTVHHFLKRLPVYVFIPVMVFATIVAVIPAVLMVLFSGVSMTESFEDESFWELLVLLCIVVPLIETAISQSLVIHGLRRFTGFSKVWIVIISAALFGAAHSYDFTYIIYAFSIGLVLAYSYIIYLGKPQSAYWVVAGIHAGRNGFSLFLQFGLPLIAGSQ